MLRPEPGTGHVGEWIGREKRPAESGPRNSVQQARAVAGCQEKFGEITGGTRPAGNPALTGWSGTGQCSLNGKHHGEERQRRGSSEGGRWRAEGFLEKAVIHQRLDQSAVDRHKDMADLR
jgi:hypothetical protein